METKYLRNKFTWRNRVNNDCISKNLGFSLFLQPLFSLAFYFIHLSSELNFFSSVLNNTLIFCYLDSKTLTKLRFFIHVPCKMSTPTVVSFKIFFTKLCFYPYQFPPSLYHVTLYEDLSSIFQYIVTEYIQTWHDHLNKPIFLYSPTMKSM